MDIIDTVRKGLFREEYLESKTKKNLFFIAVKVFVSAVLLAVIFRKAGLQNILSHFRVMDLRFFLFASALHVLVVSIAAVRWSLFLDQKYPLSKLLSLYFIGSFFNRMLPGAIGGDAVKVYYLYKDTRKAGSSFGSVFLDRYFGMIALFTIGLVSGIAGYSQLKAIGMHLAIPLIFVSFIGGSFIVFTLRIGRRFSTVDDFYDYFHRYLRGTTVLVKAFLLSLAIQALTITAIYLISIGLDRKLPFLALCVFVPVISTIAAIPVSISGLGLRETAFVALFGLLGIPAETSASISFLWFLSITTGSLVGFAEFIRYRVNPG